MAEKIVKKLPLTEDFCCLDIQFEFLTLKSSFTLSSPNIITRIFVHIVN